MAAGTYESKPLERRICVLVILQRARDSWVRIEVLDGLGMQ